MQVKYFTNGDISVINTGDNELSKNFGPVYSDGYDCRTANIVSIMPEGRGMFTVTLDTRNLRTGKALSFFLNKGNLIKMLNAADEN